jgi:hypothetical protein
MSMIAIDFEASCLPRHGRSFPIEVGIADAWGSRVWLIYPHTDWTGWDWTQEAEMLHGITRDQLLQNGQPVEIVASELAKAVEGRQVVADSYFDSYWFDTLNMAAKIAPSAKIEHVENILNTLESTTEEILAAQAELDRQGFLRHRARHDARWLFALTRILTDASAARAPLLSQGIFTWPVTGTHANSLRDCQLSVMAT